jgi:ATP-binding cassette subfamily A (ABC1) protein 3
MRLNSGVESVHGGIRFASPDSCVKVNMLSKVFETPDGPKVAVNKLDVMMYQGEIFVLLGHNEAGKTTTISILSGMMEPTNGSASILGLDLQSELDEIRKSLGACPQHNVLYDTMTVEEHMLLFAGLRGIGFSHTPSDDMKASVDKYTSEVGLSEKKQTFSAALSGGMQRKLSVALALMDDARMVFLDEPTSGMDPFSRRFTWNIKTSLALVIILLLSSRV